MDDAAAARYCRRSARRLRRRDRRGASGGLPSPPEATLGALHPEIELADLELLVVVRRELDVPLEPIVLVGLNDDDPRVVLEEDARHLLVRFAPELLVEAEARGVPQLVPLG